MKIVRGETGEDRQGNNDEPLVYADNFTETIQADMCLVILKKEYCMCVL